MHHESLIFHGLCWCWQGTTMYHLWGPEVVEKMEELVQRLDMMEQLGAPKGRGCWFETEGRSGKPGVSLYFRSFFSVNWTTTLRTCGYQIALWTLKDKQGMNVGDAAWENGKPSAMEHHPSQDVRSDITDSFRAVWHRSRKKRTYRNWLYCYTPLLIQPEFHHPMCTLRMIREVAQLKLSRRETTLLNKQLKELKASKQSDAWQRSDAICTLRVPQADHSSMQISLNFRSPK